MIALDLFAGTGWGVACQRLGITEHGVELMPEAVATREAAGMSTIFHDVWEGLDDPSIVPAHDLLIASPPCQTFSMAGSGTGRRALDEVLMLLDAGAYQHPSRMREFGLEHDPRTALVLTPLSYVARTMPTYVVLEQVPPVLPVWRAMAELLEHNGYSAVTGILNAEQYGVPQTRKRAVLIARRDKVKAAMPTPSHSRYYARDPKRLDHGVLPWVSMARALGWDDSELVGFARRADDKGAAIHLGGIDIRSRDLRNSDRPSQHVTGKARSWNRWDEPLPGQSRPRLQGHSTTGVAVWRSRPSTTIVAGSDVVSGPGWSDPVKGGVSRQDRPGSTRITVQEAAALQSYPLGMPWQGSRTKQFLQIGNAVPPLLAEAILRPLVEADANLRA